MLSASQIEKLSMGKSVSSAISKPKRVSREIYKFVTNVRFK